MKKINFKLLILILAIVSFALGVYFAIITTPVQKIKLVMEMLSREQFTEDEFLADLTKNHGLIGIELFKNVSTASLQNAKTSGNPVRYSASITATQDLLSASVTVVHKNKDSYKHYFNLSNKTQKNVPLKDIFDQKYDYLGILNLEVKSFVTSTQGYGINYYTDASNKHKIPPVSFSQPYYVSKGKLHIVFKPYTLASDHIYLEIPVTSQYAYLYLIASLT